MTIQPGTDISRYHILEQLGEGGMAVVYKAYDTQLEREVALKVLRSTQGNNEKFIKRFKLEAKALAKLNHPNIVKILDYGEQDGLPYLVMEYVSSNTLKQKVGKPMDYREAAALLAPIADALAYAHEHKILHRDVKPSNILIRDDGTPLLSDFGIAKILELDETLDLTATGVGMGTPEYMSPEVVNSMSVDQRADIYSLGIVLYELVTGRVPYRADTPMAVLYKHVNEPLVNPQKYSTDISVDISRLILKALAKDPEHRFGSAAEMKLALEKIAAGEKVGIQAPGSRSKQLLGVGAVFVLLAMIGFFVFLRDGLPAKEIDLEKAATLQKHATEVALQTQAIESGTQIVDEQTQNPLIPSQSLETSGMGLEDNYFPITWVLTDLEGDADEPYFDLISANAELAMDNTLRIEAFFKDIPQTIDINKKDTSDDAFEFGWIIVGKNEGEQNEFDFGFYHFKLPDAAPQKIDIRDEWGQESVFFSQSLVSNDINVVFDYGKNSISIVTAFPQFSPTMKLSFQAIGDGVTQDTADFILQNHDYDLPSQSTDKKNKSSPTPTPLNESASMPLFAKTLSPDEKCTPGGAYVDEVRNSQDELDILRVETSLDKNSLTITMYLKKIPTEIFIGGPDIENEIEYMWGVQIDADQNESTGGQIMNTSISGIDYNMELLCFSDNETRETGSIEDLCRAVIWEANKDDSFIEISTTEYSIDYTSNSIRLSGMIPEVTNESYLYFHSVHRWDQHFFCE